MEGGIDGQVEGRIEGSIEGRVEERVEGSMERLVEGKTSVHQIVGHCLLLKKSLQAGVQQSSFSSVLG